MSDVLYLLSILSEILFVENSLYAKIVHVHFIDSVLYTLRELIIN